mgnify:CR=1 FL=1
MNIDFNSILLQSIKIKFILLTLITHLLITYC